MVDLIEDDEGATGSGAVVVKDRLRRDLSIGDGHTVIARRVLALGILEVRVEFDADA